MAVGTFRIVRYIVGVRYSGVSVKRGSTVYLHAFTRGSAMIFMTSPNKETTTIVQCSSKMASYFMHTHTPFLFADESESESELEEDGGSTGDQPLKTMEEKLRDLNTAHDLVVKNSHQLMRLIAEVEEGGLVKPNCAKLKEKLTLFKLTTTAMVKVRAVFPRQSLSCKAL